MLTPRSRQSQKDGPNDVGTLWTMHRRQRIARCKLLAWPRRLELRVLVDGETILTDVCADAADAFALAEDWKSQMVEQGWRQVVPHRGGMSTGEQLT